MSEITTETRRESYIRRPITRADVILQEMRDGLPVSARMLAIRMGFSDLNSVRPRLTELMKEGKITAFGRTYDKFTRRSAATFVITERGKEWLES